MLGSAPAHRRRARRAVEVAAAGTGDVVGYRAGRSGDGGAVNHGIGADRSACRQGAVGGAAAIEAGMGTDHAAEREAGAQCVVQAQHRGQRRIADRHRNGVLDQAADVHVGAADGIGGLGNRDDRRGHHGLRARTVRGAIDGAVLVACADRGVDRNRAGIGRRDHIVEIEVQGLPGGERGRHAGERDRTQRRRVVGGRHASRQQGEVDACRARRGASRIADGDAVVHAGGGGVAGVGEAETAESRAAGKDGRSRASLGSHINAAAERNDHERQFLHRRTFQRPQVQALGGGEIFVRIVVAIDVGVAGTAPAAVVGAGPADAGIDTHQRVRRSGLSDRAGGTTEVSIEDPNDGRVRGAIAAIVVVDREGICRLEAVELLQRRPAVGVALHVQHREMDLAVAAIDTEVVAAGRERHRVVVQAVPQHGVAAAEGGAGEHAVVDIGRVEIDAIEADDDLVGQGVEGVEGEHAAGRHGGLVAAKVADELRIAQLRLQRCRGNRQGRQNLVDLHGIRAALGHIAEEDRVLRRLGGDARTEGRAGGHGLVISAHIAIQRGARVDETLRVGVEGGAIGVETTEGLPIAEAVGGNVAERIVQHPTVVLEIDRPGVGEHARVEVGQRTGVGADGHVPCRHSVTVKYPRSGNECVVGPATAGGCGEAHAIDAGSRRGVEARIEAVGDGLTEVSTIGASEFGRAAGDSAAPGLVAAGEVGSAWNGFVAAGPERLRVVDEDVAAVAAVARAQQDHLTGLGVDVEKLPGANHAGVDRVAHVHNAAVTGGAITRGRMQGASAFGIHWPGGRHRDRRSDHRTHGKTQETLHRLLRQVETARTARLLRLAQMIDVMPCFRGAGRAPLKQGKPGSTTAHRRFNQSGY